MKTVEDIHPDIRFFINNLNSENIRKHRIGSIQAFSFKKPKIIIYYKTNKNNIINCFIDLDGKIYDEDEFVKLLKFKIFW